MKIKCKTFDLSRTPPLKYAHWKYDGIWLTCRCEDNVIKCYSSQGTDLTRQVEDYLWYSRVHDALHGKHNAAVHGELHAPSQPASYVKHALAEGHPLTFTPFASNMLNHNAPLESLRDFFEEYDLPFAEFNKLSPGDAVDLLELPLPRGIEGFVFKNGNLIDWHKWKPVRTADLIITGFKEGDGKYLGLIGALKCSVKMPDGGMQEVCNCSGMSDDVRNDITLLGDKLRGTVVEVAYQYVGSNGRLRHPRFKGLRDDKRAIECTLDQDPDLEAYWS